MCQSNGPNSTVRRSAARHGALAGLLVTVLLVGSIQAAERYRYTAVALTEYKGTGEQALLMPTAVTVAADGTVYVVDGVNDRIVQFSDGGDILGEIHTVGDEALLDPVSARLDATGRLWIADTGHGRVLVRGPDGGLDRVIAWTSGELPKPPDLTDLALSPDGSVLWLVDNDHHQLLRYDVESGVTTTVGQFGESLGQFHYPYRLALAPDGDLAVSDVMNGRVQALNAAAQPTGVIGAYGVDLGFLYRPKGVAMDGDKNVWVADGTLHVVQVFTRDGRLIDVLRNEAGQPYRFEVPMGLAFGSQGDLYVVELQANRVVQLQVTIDATAPPVTAPRRRSGGSVGAQAHTCTICHIEWVSPLSEGQSTALMDVPANPPSYPQVSRPETCLSCHDSSVADSRQRVWVQHGHHIGVVPPATMTVPKRLPLADGRLACRTCHSAHGPSSIGTSFQKVVFLRVENSASELCAQCHATYATGPEHGMHPVGDMPIDVPGALQHHAARGDKGLTCLACHTGHGARFDRLLVQNPDSNDLCLTCHQELKPGLFGEAARSQHGRLPQLDSQQRAVATEFKTRIGSEGQLLCTTCHQPHSAPTARNLLAFDTAQQDTCAQCHAAQRGVIGTTHDLRTNHPDALNILGQTAEAGGACSACHTAHQPARPPKVTAFDTTGRCTNCHSDGELAASKQLGSVNHPQAACTGCHNPHEPQYKNYLAGPARAVCTKCHANYDSLVGGPHDIATHPSTAWPAQSRDRADLCLACHRPHGSPETGLFRAGFAAGSTLPDAGCLACHPAAMPTGDGQIALIHPRDATKIEAPPALPYGTSPEGQKVIACRTCHDPHRGDEGTALLRAAAGATAQQLCAACHADKANIAAIGHGPDPLHTAGFENRGCQPCHLIHADAQAVEPRYLWPKTLELPADLAESVPVANRHCIACHRDGGPVAPPTIATHPKVAMFNPAEPGSPGYLPLFNERGEVDPQGAHACRTCHLTHGRMVPAALPEVMVAGGSRELRARQWHVREFAAGNVCTTCHGFDALRRFLYFHDPTRRSGPIQTPPGAAPPPGSAPARPSG